MSTSTFMVNENGEASFGAIYGYTPRNAEVVVQLGIPDPEEAVDTLERSRSKQDSLVQLLTVHSGIPRDHLSGEVSAEVMHQLARLEPYRSDQESSSLLQLEDDTTSPGTTSSKIRAPPDNAPLPHRVARVAKGRKLSSSWASSSLLGVAVTEAGGLEKAVARRSGVSTTSSVSGSRVNATRLVADSSHRSRHNSTAVVELQEKQ